MRLAITASAAWMILAAVCAATAADPAATRPADSPASSSLDYWLSQAKPVASGPAEGPPAGTATAPDAAFAREDSLPGVIELSDGRQLPGAIYTTRDKDIELWVEAEKRWRRVPLINLLGLSAEVVEQAMEQEWRWKEMGVPERVYTGKEFPTMRFRWRLQLIDGSRLDGEIKGQPLWVALKDKPFGPFVLHERAKGQTGQKLSDLIYIRRVVISRAMMEKVLQAGVPGPPATSRAGG